MIIQERSGGAFLFIMEQKDGMPVSYKTVYQAGTAEIVEKRSRFIAHIEPVSSEEEAADFIGKCRKEYWDARHNCHAYCVGLSPELCKCSDDGEPAQTAGKPMLDVLLGAGLKNTAAVVTRYFGGTLLGTGGLVRAYSSAVRAGLDSCEIIEKLLCSRVTADVDYSLIGKLQYLTAETEAMELGTEYTDRARMDLLVPVTVRQQFDRLLADISGGKAKTEDHGLCYGAQAGGRVLVFGL